MIAETPPLTWGRAAAAAKICAALETPPLTWGRGIDLVTDWTHHGNTPTHVGKRFCIPWAIFRSQKHPHSRGEEKAVAAGVSAAVETPPLTWGRAKTLSRSCKSPQKHPHSRGEENKLHAKKCVIVETPPLTWGRVRAAKVKGNGAGNTPTHVGKS